MPSELTKSTDQIQSAQLERGRLASLINSMSDGVIATDETGKVVIYNAAALDLLDRNTSIEGQMVEDVLRLMDKNSQLVDVKRLIRQTKIPTSNRDYRLSYDNDGGMINLYLSVAPVRLGYGKDGQGGYVILFRDITREKSLEEERDEFISVASHELRTPVAIAEGNVGNALYVIEKHGTLDQVTSALEATHKQILFLTDLINDLSTLSRAERGRLPLELDEINAHDLVSELAENYLPQIKAKGLSLKVDLDPRLEILRSSMLYVREILQNFITNAIKYTASGTISISAMSQENGVLFSVSDTGIGISKGDQAKIFSKFFRSEDYRTRQSSGTGLGLYVTEKLAKLIKADIKMTSQLNQGSTFTFLVPNLVPNKDDKSSSIQPTAQSVNPTPTTA